MRIIFVVLLAITLMSCGKKPRDLDIPAPDVNEAAQSGVNHNDPQSTHVNAIHQ